MWTGHEVGESRTHLDGQSVGMDMKLLRAERTTIS
jgi:hypothetical protein